MHVKNGGKVLTLTKIQPLLGNVFQGISFSSTTMMSETLTKMIKFSKFQITLKC